MAASLAVILWSASGLRNGGLSRGLAFYGCITSALIIVGISIGYLRLSVHGMAAVWFGQAIWFVCLGLSCLLREGDSSLGSKALWDELTRRLRSWIKTVPLGFAFAERTNASAATQHYTLSSTRVAPPPPSFWGASATEATCGCCCSIWRRALRRIPMPLP